MSKPNWQVARLAANGQQAIRVLQEIQRAFTIDKPSDAEVAALSEVRQAIEHIEKAMKLAGVPE